jgi:hypothetical protein
LEIGFRASKDISMQSFSSLAGILRENSFNFFSELDFFCGLSRFAFKVFAGFSYRRDP